ncbi:MAG TPA: hypothetical protein VIW93_04175, partial [Candidatus Acidoferrum sp.]
DGARGETRKVSESCRRTEERSSVMSYKDPPERKKEWERLHRPQRLTRRRELRRAQAVEQTTQPIAHREASGGISLVVPLIAGGALAAYSPKLGMGACGLTLVVAAVWKKNWAWWLVECVTLFIALLF